MPKLNKPDDNKLLELLKEVLGEYFKEHHQNIKNMLADHEAKSQLRHQQLMAHLNRIEASINTAAGAVKAQTDRLQDALN